MDDPPDHKKETWLRKNHRGSEYAKHSELRRVVVDGYRVDYYRSQSDASRTGAFDLRAVTSLATHAGSSDRLAISLGRRKTIVLSFVGDGVHLLHRQTQAWKVHLASGVPSAALDFSMQAYRDETVAQSLARKHGADSLVLGKRRQMAPGPSAAAGSASSPAASVGSTGSRRRLLRLSDIEESAANEEGSSDEDNSVSDFDSAYYSAMATSGLEGAASSADVVRHMPSRFFESTDSIHSSRFGSGRSLGISSTHNTRSGSSENLASRITAPAPLRVGVITDGDVEAQIDHFAASIVASFVRGWLIRRALRKLHSSATIINARVRGMLARRDVIIFCEQMELDWVKRVEAMAVTRINAQVRGQLARQEYRRRRTEAARTAAERAERAAVASAEARARRAREEASARADDKVARRARTDATERAYDEEARRARAEAAARTADEEVRHVQATARADEATARADEAAARADRRAEWRAQAAERMEVRRAQATARAQTAPSAPVPSCNHDNGAPMRVHVSNFPIPYTLEHDGTIAPLATRLESAQAPSAYRNELEGTSLQLPQKSQPLQSSLMPHRRQPVHGDDPTIGRRLSVECGDGHWGASASAALPPEARQMRFLSHSYDTTRPERGQRSNIIPACSSDGRDPVNRSVPVLRDDLDVYHPVPQRLRSYVEDRSKSSFTSHYDDGRHPSSSHTPMQSEGRSPTTGVSHPASTGAPAFNFPIRRPELQKGGEGSLSTPIRYRRRRPPSGSPSVTVSSRHDDAGSNRSTSPRTSNLPSWEPSSRATQEELAMLRRRRNVSGIVSAFENRGGAEAAPVAAARAQRTRCDFSALASPPAAAVLASPATVTPPPSTVLPSPPKALLSPRLAPATSAFVAAPPIQPLSPPHELSPPLQTSPQPSAEMSRLQWFKSYLQSGHYLHARLLAEDGEERETVRRLEELERKEKRALEREKENARRAHDYEMESARQAWLEYHKATRSFDQAIQWVATDQEMEELGELMKQTASANQRGRAQDAANSPGGGASFPDKLWRAWRVLRDDDDAAH